MVANPARGQLDREYEIFLCPCLRLRIRSRETGSAVPSRVSPFVVHTRAKYVTGSIISAVPVCVCMACTRMYIGMCGVSDAVPPVKKKRVKLYFFVSYSLLSGIFNALPRCSCEDLLF